MTPDTATALAVPPKPKRGGAGKRVILRDLLGLKPPETGNRHARRQAWKASGGSWARFRRGT